MPEWITDFDFQRFATDERVWNATQAFVVLVVGLALVRLLATGIGRSVERRVGAQEAMVTRRLINWVLGALVFVTALHQLGFNLSVLLGAAGVFTVALGFASQTSASNLISGLFLMAERPFVVGDLIRVDDKIGEVLSVDLLSVKLRTFDNLFVRVPNEEIIKKHITNLTHFPIRRVDLKIGVAYKEDLQRVKEILWKVAEENPMCMTEPEPLFVFQRYGDSALEFQFSVWGTRENYLELLNSMYLEIKASFDREGIEIPFPHRSLYAGSATGPLPVRLVADPEGGTPSEGRGGDAGAGPRTQGEEA